MISDYFHLAFRNLKRRGLRSYLTLLGVFIGIAVVVALISLGNGLRTAVNSQFGISTTQVITVQAGGISGFGPPGTSVSKPLTKSDSEAIERLSVIDLSVPRSIESIRAEFNDILVFTFGASIPDGEKRKFIYESIEIEPEFGRMLEDDDRRKIVIGNDFSLAEKSGFGKPVKIGDRLLLNGVNFEVKGILAKKGSFIIDRAILIQEKDLEEISNIGDTVDIIAVKVKDKDLLDRARQDIEELMRKRRDVKKGQEDFEVSTPEAQLATVNQILLGVQIFIILIALISILIGAIGIVNTMFTSVLERKKDIGIMKAIGAKNSDIFIQFFLEAGLLGLIGGIFGALFGIGIGYMGTTAINVYLGALTKPEINISLILFSLIGSFIIGAFSGIVPAMNAARQNPVDALRG